MDNKKESVKKIAQKSKFVSSFYKIFKKNPLLLKIVKWVYQKRRHKKRKNFVPALRPIFEAPQGYRNFFTIFRGLVFVVLFIGLAGLYLWFQVIRLEIEKEGTSSSRTARLVSNPVNPEKESQASRRDPVTEKASSLSPAFTLQPYLKSSAHSSLIDTINPQFFIQAAPNQQQKIAIIIVGLGINQGLTEKIVDEAPRNISLAFSPYTPDLEGEISVATDEEFAVLVMVPLEDEDPITDLGYLTLKTGVSGEENLRILQKIVEKGEGATCLYGQGGARLTRSPHDLYPILKSVRTLNNCFVAPADVLVNKLHQVAAATGVNYVCTTMENPTEEMWPAIEALTQRTGFAVLAFQAHDGVLEEMKGWIKKLEKSNISLVPLTDIIHAE